MSSFSGYSFSLKVDSDGNTPLPSRDSDGVASLKVDIAFQTLATYTALQGLVARGTAKVVNGTLVTNYHSNSGQGSHTLVVPWIRGQSKTYSAVLTELTLLTNLAATHPDGWFTGSANFIILTKDL